MATNVAGGEQCLAQGPLPVDGNCVGAVPVHVQRLADKNPGKVTVTEWRLQKPFAPLNPVDLVRFHGKIHCEFCSTRSAKLPTAWT